MLYYYTVYFIIIYLHKYLHTHKYTVLIAYPYKIKHSTSFTIDNGCDHFTSLLHVRITQSGDKSSLVRTASRFGSHSGLSHSRLWCLTLGRQNSTYSRAPAYSVPRFSPYSLLSLIALNSLALSIAVIMSSDSRFHLSLSVYVSYPSFYARYSFLTRDVYPFSSLRRSKSLR